MVVIGRTIYRSRLSRERLAVSFRSADSGRERAVLSELRLLGGLDFPILVAANLPSGYLGLSVSKGEFVVTRWKDLRGPYRAREIAELRRQLLAIRKKEAALSALQEKKEG